MSYMAWISVIIDVLGCSFESKLICFKQPIKKYAFHMSPSQSSFRLYSSQTSNSFSQTLNEMQHKGQIFLCIILKVGQNRKI